MVERHQPTGTPTRVTYENNLPAASDAATDTSPWTRPCTGPIPLDKPGQVDGCLTPARRRWWPTCTAAWYPRPLTAARTSGSTPQYYHGHLTRAGLPDHRPGPQPMRPSTSTPIVTRSRPPCGSTSTPWGPPGPTSYCGLAAYYFLRGFNDDGMTAGAGKLPAGSGPAVTGTAREIEIAIQDRMFDTQGQLFFPDMGINPQHPFWVPEFAAPRRRDHGERQGLAQAHG